jgi:hypothetical protein
MAGGRSRAATIALLATMASACASAQLTHDATETTAAETDAALAQPDKIPCEVSRLLVPSCGAWFGASTPSHDGTYDYRRGLEEYEQLVGVEPDILHFYQRGSEPFPTVEHKALAERPGHARSILYINWKPAPELTWRQIADGAAEASIASVASGLIDYPHQLFLTIQHEPEDDVIDEAGSGMTPADYVAMYRHVVAGLRTLGVDNVVFVMGYMGFERWSSMVDRLYPGDDVVDWIAYDPYGFASHDTFPEVLNDPGDDGWPGFYFWATEKSPGTPIMLAEWGFDLRRRTRAPEMLGEVTASLQREFPMIKALVYWNDRGERVDARLGQEGDIASRFAQAYAELAMDPYFNETPIELAP